MPLADALQIRIGLDSAPVTSQGLGTVLVLSATAAFSERLRYYRGAAEVLADPDAGFTSSSPEYLVAVAMFSQDSPTRPEQIAIGRLSTLVARVRQINITGNTDGAYTATFSQRGVEKVATFNASGNSSTEIRDGLLASIDLLEIDGEAFVEADSIPTTDNMTVSALVAGADFTLSVSGPGGPDIEIDASTTAPVTIADGVAAILAEDATGWYGVATAGLLDPVLQYDLAVVTETLEKLCAVWMTGETPVSAASTEDLGYQLAQLGLVRTVPVYHSDGSGSGRWAAAAILANRLVNNPDQTSTIFAFAELGGIPIDSFSDSTATVSTQQTALEGKNVNYYGEDGNGGEFYPGTAPGGQWLDLVISRDWLEFRLLERYKALRKNATNRGSKLPYTDAGISLYEAETRAQIDRGLEIGHFTADSKEPVYTFPSRATALQADIDARHLRFEFAVEPAGAIQSVEGTGSIGTITGSVVTPL